MSKLESHFSSIEQVQLYFKKRTSLLNECAGFKGIDRNGASFVRKLQYALIELQNIFHQIKSAIHSGETQVMEMKHLLKSMELLNDKLDYMKSFSSSIQRTTLPEVLPSAETNDKETLVSSKKTKISPTHVIQLSPNEFESIPKYLKNRIKCSEINEFIETFNKVIDEKYKIFSMPRKLMKPSEIKALNQFKLDEVKDTKGFYFCIGDNLNEYGNVKMNKITNNYISILRHCKRLKEVRGPGPIVRYVIMK